MEKERSYKKADYPNRTPSWRTRKWRRENTLPKEKPTQVERVLKSLDWGKLATIGKEDSQCPRYKDLSHWIGES